MVNRSYSDDLPTAVRRVAGAFRIAGWVSFWIQIVLGVISGIVLAFAGSGLGRTPSTAVGPNGVPIRSVSNPETGIGLFLAVVGLLVLFAGAFWAFRYTRLSRRLKILDAQNRPKPGNLTQALRFGLLINLVGMLLSIFGAQAIVGSLVGKSAAQGFAMFSGGTLNFITPLDIFLVQANTNTIMAHFAGLVATLWLLQSMSRQ
jgi:hypothetical protein